VLFITAYKSEQLAAEVARHGDGYLTKPFSPQELLQAVQETLERRGKPLPSARVPIKRGAKRSPGRCGWRWSSWTVTTGRGRGSAGRRATP
jgi:DNA-binding response OmpR family regulator